MNKKIRIPLIIICVLVTLYFFCNATGMLKIYKNPTITNEPNLKANSYIWVSNLVTPKKGDFVCFKHENDIEGKHIRVSRLIGTEKDTLEIINGNVFINNINIDVGIDLIHFYNLSKNEYFKIQKELDNGVNQILFIDDDSFKILLQDSFAKKHNLTSKRVIEAKDSLNTFFQKTYNKNWNKDNFGPIVITNEKYFVIGDNRDNSEDSRYIGLINKNDVVGVAVKP